MLNMYGYGRPDFERAFRAASNDAWLVHDDTITLDSFQILELPEIPREFVDTKGRRRIAVTLAFDPPTRASRADSYLGVTMEFALWRNTKLEEIRDAYKKWDRDEAADLDEDAAPPTLGEIAKGKIDMLPKSNRRKTSTVQHAWKDFQRSGNLKSGSPVYLVVICQRKWAPPSIERQRYAVVLSLSHENETVDLQAQIRVQAKIQTALRARTRT